MTPTQKNIVKDRSSEITELENKIRQAAYDYETDGTSPYTDMQYDAMEAKLRSLDPDSPVLKDVGSKMKSGKGKTAKIHWKKAAHQQPMGSLNKVQTEQEFREWAQKLGNPKFTMMPKFDGLSISLEYRSGQFYRAITRGDGFEGDDVTANVSRISFPKTIADSWSGFVRGEVMLRHKAFVKNFPGEKNPRNSAVGTLKRLDGSKCEFLTIFVYDTSEVHKTKSDEIDKILSLGFEYFPTVTGTADEVVQYYNDYIKTFRASLDYDIDGLVIAVDDTNRHASLGMSDMRPKGSVAFKFPHEECVSILRDIVWQVGNSGRVNPVAIFDTVQVAGVSVSRASLATAARVNSLKLFAGCRVVISRRNDCIPYLEKNLDV